MTTKRKAGSSWSCSKCEYSTTLEPGRNKQGRPCDVPKCIGKLRYMGGRFVWEDDPEFEKISDYYLVRVANTPVQSKEKLVDINAKNRMTLGGSHD